MPIVVRDDAMDPSTKKTLKEICKASEAPSLDLFYVAMARWPDLLENFWAPVYPLLDPEDNNDPTQRLNILGSLTAPRGSVGGWLRVVDYLYEAPLGKPKGAGPITFDDIAAAKLREACDAGEKQVADELWPLPKYREMLFTNTLS